MMINKNIVFQSCRDLGLYLTVISVLLFVVEVDGVEPTRLGLLSISGITLWVLGIYNQDSSSSSEE
ncbi:hypothetical protein MMIC_P1581 [Mariprofundus micogutta]|uniref:Uncharacterized protein n=1 Tax=Mariprofundus micogutta TaxID=1921010 RepID=A0A1L8CP53_9PROT|nr:hypothetical protein MMIC_P1581 [Mariprofundus micogutta]